MELDTHELFHCQAYDCNWWQIVWCFKSGLHCTSLYNIAFKALNFLEVSEVFRSFICIFKSNLYIHNHVSQKAKGEISNWDAILNHETAIQVQAMFPTKNTQTIDTDDQKFNCDNANGHSQTGNWKKISASWIWKTSHKNKSNEKRLETLLTRRWSNIYLHKLPLIVDLTDIKSSIVLKFNWWTDDFCYFNDAKRRSNISINVLTQSIIRVMWIDANFLKSCQLILYLEFAYFRNFLQELNNE